MIFFCNCSQVVFDGNIRSGVDNFKDGAVGIVKFPFNVCLNSFPDKDIKDCASCGNREDECGCKDKKELRSDTKIIKK